MREQFGLTMEEKPRTRFGNYELVKRIDVGGMGEVYLASQLSAFGRPVAIKIIRNDLVHDITARARFLREAEVSARLKHEHILPLFEFGEEEGRLFLVTPYIEGGTLATRLKDRGPLSLKDTRKLFVPLVQAVGYIHRRGVIHRDLKPTNILLDTEDGEVYVRLIDFGIASLQGHSASPPLTTAGHEMGTIAYMAPERLSGIAAPSNDIFSLGVILYQILTARMPIPTPSSSNSSVLRLPDPLAQVVRRSIATDPAERYATAEELLKGFEEAYQQVLSRTQAGTSSAGPGTSGLTTNRLELDMPELTPAPQQERVSLSHSAEIATIGPEKSARVASRPPLPERFAPEDYNAPTTFLQPQQPYTQPPTRRPPLRQPSQKRQQQKSRMRSPLLIISIGMVALLAIIGTMLFYGYQTVNAASVSVNFAPQVRTISQVFSIKAGPNVKAVNTANATIPEEVANSSKTEQKQGGTTGVICNFLLVCQQAVSQEDVNNLTNQITPSLNQSIIQDLQGQISQAHGRQVGQINIFNQTVQSNPQPNQPGKTVTVTVTEQGNVGYILDAQATNVVQQELQAMVTQMGQGFQIVNSTLHIGSPTITGTDPASGLTNISVPAGVVAKYQFTQAQLDQISNSLVGKSLAQATAFLKSYPGIDSTSVNIRFTSGSGPTMPGDTQHIRIIPLPPGTLPNVPLTPVTSTNNGN